MMKYWLQFFQSKINQQNKNHNCGYGFEDKKLEIQQEAVITAAAFWHTVSYALGP